MRKSHPIRRVVLATAATVSGVVLLLSLKPSSDPTAAAAGTAPQQTAGAQQSPQGATRPAGAAGGTVTGDATQTQYGTVQVRLTVAGGKIAKAEAVQAPKGGLSDQKTAMAVPKLNQEAVAAQSARIDAVSGATYTSNGYKKSLQSALDRMKSAAAPAPSASSPAASGSGAGSGSTSGSGAAQARSVTATGKVAQTPYGPVQVRITVSGGRIAQAAAVQAPKGGLSDQKTAMAVPKLNQEAVAAGTAHIDAVSGATYTSTGYRQSLQSALDQAGG
ncbi:FMN-binding protein [Streptomyces sp. MUSC 14]|uniref:FMN-binding protein n=1 Tax=Streptomyces sp. MUSC 14 TaxID=1354889 RepID=UPI000B073159|nr:FMN-binding protein [Streptomyces sp. MUSC 14]